MRLKSARGSLQCAKCNAMFDLEKTACSKRKERCYTYSEDILCRRLPLDSTLTKLLLTRRFGMELGDWLVRGVPETEPAGERPRESSVED